MLGRSLAIAQCLAGHTLLSNWLLPKECTKEEVPQMAAFPVEHQQEVADKQLKETSETERNDPFVSRKPGSVITHRVISKEPSWCVC